MCNLPLIMVMRCFIKENQTENVVWKMAAFLSQHRHWWDTTSVCAVCLGNYQFAIILQFFLLSTWFFYDMPLSVWVVGHYLNLLYTFVTHLIFSANINNIIRNIAVHHIWRSQCFIYDACCRMHELIPWLNTTPLSMELPLFLLYRVYCQCFHYCGICTHI